MKAILPKKTAYTVHQFFIKKAHFYKNKRNPTALQHLSNNILIFRNESFTKCNDILWHYYQTSKNQYVRFVGFL